MHTKDDDFLLLTETQLYISAREIHYIDWVYIWYQPKYVSTTFVYFHK